MARQAASGMSPGAFEVLASRTRSGWRLVRSAVAGALLLAIWLALWTWLVAGVARPLSRAEAALHGQAPAVVDDGT